MSGGYNRFPKWKTLSEKTTTCIWFRVSEKAWDSKGLLKLAQIGTWLAQVISLVGWPKLVKFFFFFSCDMTNYDFIKCKKPLWLQQHWVCLQRSALCTASNVSCILVTTCVTTCVTCILSQPVWPVSWTILCMPYMVIKAVAQNLIWLSKADLLYC